MSHYDELGVAPTAPLTEVRQAYVALARRYHPDRAGGDAARMQAINAAWETLSDPERRARYDDALAPSSSATWSAPPAAEEVEAAEDDAAIGGTVVLPQWASLLPVGAFAGSAVVFVMSVLMQSPGGVGLAVALFLVSCTLFLASPFIALLASRRGSGGQ
jgi:curved DNA-binding protein CbpA